MSRPTALLRTFAVPGALACVSLAGLFAALLADGLADLAATAAVAAPVLSLIWIALIARRRASDARRGFSAS